MPDHGAGRLRLHQARTLVRAGQTAVREVTVGRDCRRTHRENLMYFVRAVLEQQTCENEERIRRYRSSGLWYAWRTRCPSTHGFPPGEIMAKAPNVATVEERRLDSLIEHPLQT